MTMSSLPANGGGVRPGERAPDDAGPGADDLRRPQS